MTLDRGKFGMDGVLNDEEIPAEQRLHVQRPGRGIYVGRAVADGTIPDLPEGIR